MVEKTANTHVEEQRECGISTKEDLVRQLQSLGIQKGMLVLVNADTKRLGYLVGGPQILVEALIEVVGYEGTIVMPTFTPQMADPACQKKRVNRTYWDEVRKNALPFDRKLSNPVQCDQLIHQFLRNDGVTRSYHPLYSFAAWGKYAKLICDKHPLHFGLSQDSPLGKISELNGYALLLGCDYDSCTMFHLARYNGEQLPIKVVSAPIENNKHLYWKDMLDLDLEIKNFSEVGEVMEERNIVRTTYLGTGKCRLFSAREAVTFATAYFHIHKD